MSVTYRTYGERDEAPGLDGDRAFRGVDMLTEPAQVEAGLVSLARNCRFRTGRLETRPGIRKLNWVQRIGATFPLVFPIDFQRTLPFVEVYGVGRFDDPNGVEWIFLAGSRYDGVGEVWVTRPFNGIQSETLPTGEVITGPVEFVQAADKLFLYRGPDAARLVLTQVGAGFRVVAEPAADSGKITMPDAERAVWFQNRLVSAFGRDEVAISDVLDPEYYGGLTSTARVNQGSSDRLVGLYKFNDSTIVAAKEQSLYAIGNLVPDAQGQYSGATLEEITRSFGFVAARSVVSVGADLLGLSQLGVMSIRQTEQNKLQGVVRPMSTPVEPLIKRINWQYAGQACAAYWDSKYYLAVPLDDAEKEANEIVPAGAEYSLGTSYTLLGLEPGRKYRVRFGANEAQISVPNSGSGGGSTVYLAADGGVDFVATNPTGTQTYIVIAPAPGAPGEPLTLSIKEMYSGVNNAVLVYDFVTQAWAGYDDGEGLTVKGFVTLRYQGQERLFFISADGFLNLYEEGFDDERWQWAGYSAEVDVGDTFDVGVKSTAIETEWITRGYGTRQLQNNGMQRADLGEIQARGAVLPVRTWNPRLSLWERPDGVNEENAVWTAVTRSRTNYRQPWDAPPWDDTNRRNDHGTKQREDYSADVTNGMFLEIRIWASGVSYVVNDRVKYANGNYYECVAAHTSSGGLTPLDTTTWSVLSGYVPEAGVNFEAHQETVERVTLRGRGRCVQLRGLCDQGRVEVKGVEMVQAGGRRRGGSLG